MNLELVVFDFDGTLAHRPGMWSQCLLDVLYQQQPEHGVTIDELRMHLRDGFPWHNPDVPHLQISDADEWWRMLDSLLDRVYRGVGVKAGELAALRDGVRSHYCDAAHFQLFPDTVDALQLLSDADVAVDVLSNHVPELPSIVTRLGLDPYIRNVFTSALIGYEKPHPETFRIALGRTAPEQAWMIGDNPIADRCGATDVGMHGALVRHPDADYPTAIDAVQAILRQ